MGQRLFYSSLIVFLTVACTKVNVALDLAPRFTTEMIDDYFDLDSKTKSDLRSEIQKDLKSLYACCFKEAFAELDKEFVSYKGENAPPESVDRILALYEKNKPAVIAQEQPGIEKFINNLTEKHIQYFEKEMKSKIEDDTEDIADRDKMRIKMVDRFERNFEFLCVDLERGHLKKAEEFFNDHPFPYAERLKIKKELLAKMQATPDLAKKKALLLDYSLGRGFDRANYNLVTKKFQRDVVGFSLYIYNGLTAPKKAQCYKAFQGRVEEFRIYFAKSEK